MFERPNVVFIHPENASAGAAGQSTFSEVPPAADPIFAAIERLRSAEAQHTAADIRRNEARADSDEAAISEADALENRAAVELRAEAATFVATVPLTLAGARAGLAFALEFDEGGYQLRPFVESLLRSPIWTPAPAGPILTAIERHKALLAEIEALPKDEDVSDRLADAEGAALHDVATLPCPDDATFLVKLRYLLADHKLEFGPAWRETEARQIMIALELHLSGEIIG